MFWFSFSEQERASFCAKSKRKEKRMLPLRKKQHPKIRPKGEPDEGADFHSVAFADGFVCGLSIIRSFLFRAIRESPLRTHINFGGELIFSADLCYNGTNEKPSSGRKVAREA